MGSVHTTLGLVLDFRTQAFDLKSVSIKRIVCSIDCGEWLTDCIQHGAFISRLDSQLKLVTAETNEIVRDSLTDGVTPSFISHRVDWHWLSHRLTVSWSVQHDLALTPRDWVSGRSRSLVGYAENHNETTSVRDRITAIFSVHWTGEWSLELNDWLGHEVEPSQLKCFTIPLTTFTSPIVTNCNLIHLTTSCNTTL